MSDRNGRLTLEQTRRNEVLLSEYRGKQIAPLARKILVVLRDDGLGANIMIDDIHGRTLTKQITNSELAAFLPRLLALLAETTAMLHSNTEARHETVR